MPYYARLEVLTEVLLKIHIFQDITVGRGVNISRFWTLDREDEGITVLRNTANRLLNDKA